MKRYLPPLLLGCLTLFYLNEIWRSSKGTHAPATYTCTEHAQYEAKHDNILTDAWNWTTQDPVRSIPPLLAIFTGALVLVAGVQIRYLIRADVTARRSANAARTAALAAHDQAKIAERQLTELSRAYIFATPIPSIEDGRTIVRLRMENVGQTPGFVREGYGANTNVEPAGEPVYPPKIGNPRILEDAVIRANSSPENFPTSWWAPITEPHFFFGYIKYIDIFRREHTTRFCVKIFPAEGKLDRAGPPAWNEWN